MAPEARNWIVHLRLELSGRDGLSQQNSDGQLTRRILIP